jgi:hypothetical protein
MSPLDPTSPIHDAPFEIVTTMGYAKPGKKRRLALGIASLPCPPFR